MLVQQFFCANITNLVENGAFHRRFSQPFWRANFKQKKLSVCISATNNITEHPEEFERFLATKSDVTFWANLANLLPTGILIWRYISNRI